jgi:YidC/Oxa1 family membrane protein insertase
MDKNTFIAVALSLMILVLWPILFNHKKPVPVANPTQQAQTIVNNEAGQKGVVNKTTGTATLTIKPITNAEIYYIENDLVKVGISSNGAKLTQVVFKKYSDDKKNLIKFFGTTSEQLGALSVDEFDKAVFRPTVKSPNSLTLESGRTKIQYTIKDGVYFVETKINDPKLQRLNVKVLSSFTEGSKDDYGLSSEPEKRKRDYLVYANEKVERVSNKDLAKNRAMSFSSSPNWVGLSDRYFLFSIIGSTAGEISDVGLNYQESIPAYIMSYSLNNKDGEFLYKMFVGPKDVNDLRKADPSLSDSINYGWLAIISVPILELMKFFYRVIPNYGVAILLLTLFVRLLMFPLQQKSMKSMKRMQELQPHIKQLQEKHKDNKEKLNIEMVQFMKTHKMNPMSGCLPMLVQLPVFIALYKVLANAVELYRSPFIFWIHDLSVKDPYYVFPIIMGAMMFIQQKITPNATMDQAQAKMMLYMLPILFTVMMIGLPSGLTLYIMFSTFLGIAQQYLMNKQTSVKTI